MKFYGIEVEGQLEIQEVETLPTFSVDYMKCIIYNLEDNLIYFGTDTEWKKVGDIPIETSNIPDLDTSKITTGIFTTDQIPDLDTSKITTGIFTTDQIPDLDASKITTGTIEATRLPSLPTTPTSITETSTNTTTETTHTHAIGSDSNAYGKRYISTATPSGGINGDIWMKY